MAKVALFQEGSAFKNDFDEKTKKNENVNIAMVAAKRENLECQVLWNKRRMKIKLKLNNGKDKVQKFVIPKGITENMIKARKYLVEERISL